MGPKRQLAIPPESEISFEESGPPAVGLRKARSEADWSARLEATVTPADEVAAASYLGWPMVIIAPGLLATVAWVGLLGWVAVRLLPAATN